MSNRDTKQRPGLFDRVDRKGTRSYTLVAFGAVLVVLALLVLLRGGLPGPEKEESPMTDTGPKGEGKPASRTPQ